ISVEEYIEAYKEQQAQRGRGTRGAQVRAARVVPADEPAEEEKRPTVYRVGNLPKELPPWFTELDTDKDAQVGLYEWLAAGRSAAEFQAMDRNGDGFLTVEEVLRYQKATAKKDGQPGTGTSTAPGPGPAGAAPGPGGRPGRGMRGMPGRGPGGAD